MNRDRAADENNVALAGNEAAACKLAYQSFIDGRTAKVKIINVLCQGELGYPDLIFDRACLFFADLGLQEIADDERRVMLALDATRHDHIIGNFNHLEPQLY